MIKRTDYTTYVFSNRLLTRKSYQTVINVDCTRSLDRLLMKNKRKVLNLIPIIMAMTVEEKEKLSLRPIKIICYFVVFRIYLFLVDIFRRFDSITGVIFKKRCLRF